MMGIAFCSSTFIVIWQFAQFSLFTQLCAVYAIFVLRIIPRDTLMTVVYGQMVRAVTSLAHSNILISLTFSTQNPSSASSSRSS